MSNTRNRRQDAKNKNQPKLQKQTIGALYIEGDGHALYSDYASYITGDKEEIEWEFSRELESHTYTNIKDMTDSKRIETLEWKKVKPRIQNGFNPLDTVARKLMT